MRTKFQVVALLVREERARVNADETISDAYRAEQLKRLDGVATILAKTAARDTSLLALLAEDAVVSDAARSLKREMLRAAGIEPPPRTTSPPSPRPPPPRPSAGWCRSRSSRGSSPTPSSPRTSVRRVRASRARGAWPPGSCSARCSRRSSAPPAERRHAWPCPSRPRCARPGGLELMPHQAQLVAAAAAGHRTFLLADEPGLGKTAQALLAAQAANAYPLLVVVPNVVKTNWAREAGLWTPNRPATVIHGDGDTIDGFADIVVVNYEVLDRHVGWLGDLGFRGMVVDEAHFIKNKTSQRSQHVLRALRADPGPHRASAADGADRYAADQRHRGLPGDLAVPRLDRREEAARRADGRARGDRPDAGRPRVLPAPRAPCVIDLGIVRRRKVDVAADIPARRIADLPVELDDAGRPLDPGGRARARPPPGVALRERARDADVRRRRRGHRPRPGTPGRRAGSARTRPRRRPARTCSA